MACLSFCAYIHFQCTIAHSIHVFDKRSEAITALCCYPTFFSKIHSRELLFFLDVSLCADLLWQKAVLQL